MRKVTTAGLMVWATLSIAGCYVASLSPFYDDDDIILDDGLIGTWEGGEEEKWTITRAADVPATYQLAAVEDASPRPGAPKVVSRFNVRLFQLDDTRYMDWFPSEDAHCAQGATWWALRSGLHALLRVSRDGDTLRAQALDVDAVDALLQAKTGSTASALPRILIPLTHVHLSDGRAFDRPGGKAGANLVLTASTADIQEFIRRHAGEIFGEEVLVLRRRVEMQFESGRTRW